MKVELKKLELSNYRNIKHAVYEFDGNSKIVGENRIGKTNTLEAIVWLLTDKLLNGSSDIAQIKPLEDTKAEVRVEGTFLVGDKTITIRKDYGEDWVKVRSTEQLVFKGHYLTYYYNGVKQKTQKDFYAMFLEDFGLKGDFKNIDVQQLLVNPFYVGDLGETGDWKLLREFIIHIIGDVQDSDVFSKNEKLLPIKADLDSVNGRIDQVKKMYKNQIEGSKEQVVRFDGQIELLEKTPRPTDEELKVANKAIDDINNDILKLQGDLSSDAMYLEIEKEIATLRNKAFAIEREDLRKAKENPLKARHEELNALYKEQLVSKYKIREIISQREAEVSKVEAQIELCTKNRYGFLETLNKIDAELDAPFDAVCPTCHRPLEGEELEKAHANHKANLEASKESVLTQGRANKKLMEEKKQQLETLKASLEEANSGLSKIETDIAQTLELIESVGNQVKEQESQPIPTNPEVVEINNKISELEVKKRQVAADIDALNVSIKEKIQEKLQERVEFQKVVDDFNYYLKQQEQLETVKKLKKETTNSLLGFEQKMVLVDTFIKTKLEMLDENVARVFGNIKFQLIKENINGGYDPICKPYIYDVEKGTSTNVSWKSGSKSERVITGIAICEKIKAALNLPDLPFLFDEGGEISTDTFNTKFKTDAQLICVKVVDNITNPMVMKI